MNCPKKIYGLQEIITFESTEIGEIFLSFEGIKSAINECSNPNKYMIIEFTFTEGKYVLTKEIYYSDLNKLETI